MKVLDDANLPPPKLYERHGDDFLSALPLGLTANGRAVMKWNNLGGGGLNIN